MTLYVGTAAWGIPRAVAHAFGPGGSNLERYATRLPAVEINTTFYRPHRPATFARWAASVPAGFRFAVKLPRAITHEARLVAADAALSMFLEQIAGLGTRMGPLLVQLPPSLVFDAGIAARFFAALRLGHAGLVACEPRHPSWFTDAAAAMLVEWRVARVAADPSPVPAAARPGGWPGLVYHRWHGAPELYWSDYGPTGLRAIAQIMATPPAGAEAWCIFDNTAAGAATENALAVAAVLGRGSDP